MFDLCWITQRNRLDLRLCGFLWASYHCPRALNVSERGPAVSEDASWGGPDWFSAIFGMECYILCNMPDEWMEKQCVHTINKTAWHHNFIMSLNLFLILQMCVSGSSDIQEDHSKEQCQEKEDVWVIHRDATTAYVLGGLGFFSLMFRKLQKTVALEVLFSQTCCHPQLSERMKVVDVISSKVFADSQRIIAQVTAGFYDPTILCFSPTYCAAAVLILSVCRVI